MIPVKVYDSPTASEPKADLGEAFEISYTQKAREVWTAEFSLPADDPHLDLIDRGRDLAEVFDNGERVELFQITNKIPTRDEDGHPKVTFKLKQVLNYLYRDLCGENLVLDPDTGNYRSLQKTGISAALSFIIGEQSVSRWQLGNVDFSASYTYEFNKIKLLDAIRKVPNALWKNWQFSFDTTSYPWTLNIVAPNTEPQALIYYGKNMESIRQEVDPEDLVTKVYAYGAGSGEDEITAGPFTDDPHGYGIIEDVFNDHRFEDTASLASAAQNWLDKHNSPKVTYTGEAADYQVRYGTNDFQVGDCVTVYDAMLGIGADVRVIELAKEDVGNNPVLDYTLSNKFQEETNFGALAFQDKVDQTDIAPRSISGGFSGGLGSVGSLKNNSLYITALNDDGNWGTRISINENGIATNVTDIDGNKSSITQNADAISLKVDATVDGVMSYMNLSGEGIELATDGEGHSQIQLKPSGNLKINASKEIDIDAPNINITSLNDDDSWGSRIAVNETQISSNVTDIEGNSSSIVQNATDITLKVSKDDVINQINISTEGITIDASQLGITSDSSINIDAAGKFSLNAGSVNITSLNDDGGWGSSISVNSSQISTNVSDISGNQSSISQNATDIGLRVKKNDVINQINISTEGVKIAGANIEVSGSTTFTSGYDPSTKLGASAQAVDTAKVQGNTIIEGGYIKTGFLEADFAKIDTLDLTDTSLLTNSVKEGGADETIDHVSAGTYSLADSEIASNFVQSAELFTDTESFLDSASLDKYWDDLVYNVSTETKEINGTTVVTSIDVDTVSALGDVDLDIGSADAVVPGSGTYVSTGRSAALTDINYVNKDVLISTSS